MKRKVVQHGASTLIISLPNKWAKTNNVKKGTELEVEERGSELVIGADTEAESEKFDINITGRYKIAHRAISALYKAGYDQLNITFSTPEEEEEANYNYWRSLTSEQRLELHYLLLVHVYSDEIEKNKTLPNNEIVFDNEDIFLKE